MLEAAMFGGIPEGRRPYDFTYPSQISSDGHSALYPRALRPPSPTLTAQRLLREQQVFYHSHNADITDLILEQL